jgi:hypothetical protein
MRNWKILLIIASLTVSAGLTSCSNKEKETDTTKTETTTTAPAAGMSPAGGAKDDKILSKYSKDYLKSYEYKNSVDQILKSLKWGNIAFNSPEEMNVGESTTIKLILSGNQSIRQIETMLKKDKSQKDEILGAKVKISELMKADLNASESDFKIELLSDKEQAISTNELTEWIWKVTPKKAGKKEMYLKLSAIVKISDQTLNQTLPLTIKTFDKYIDVKISTAKMLSMFLSDNWQWLWTTILIPLAPFFWNGYQKRKEKM